MYSADGIAKRRNGRAEPTEEMIAGLVCSVCRTDYRRSPDKDARVVSHHGDTQLLACEGVCARMASGSVTGVDETPLPLADRVRNYEVGR
ncbi:hypothetical protein [Actinacidiphila soli]|jgi:hypothetical protein|uniref:hypothetical protein n=1 Tax=Actinacidiphila soli TaxID=2487275 RepID=UPI000FCB111D|nr:hypothetical protein [Actinacidiphila soli]MDX6312397.1 hypothetical protein [Streptomyces sp.]